VALVEKVNLTPFIPLSKSGEGEEKFKRALALLNSQREESQREAKSLLHGTPLPLLRKEREIRGVRLSNL
jgi:hypothetical protein